MLQAGYAISLATVRGGQPLASTLEASMTKPRSFLLVIASLIAVNAASSFTLEHNLSAGVYPIDADSIGLPLIEGFIASGQAGRAESGAPLTLNVSDYHYELYSGTVFQGMPALWQIH